jgi:hypothetical protein
MADNGCASSALPRFASFDFLFRFTDLPDAPPNNVPESGSLALMGAGILAAAVSRHARPRGRKQIHRV